MTGTIIKICAIISLSAIACVWIYTHNNRYTILVTDRGAAYQVDRRTGQSWFLRGTQKIVQEDPEIKELFIYELSDSVISKIEGNAGLRSNGYFAGKLYNGSEAHLKRIKLGIVAKSATGQAMWDREFLADINIHPLQAGSFSILMPTTHDVAETSWYIRGVYGFEP